MISKWFLSKTGIIDLIYHLKIDSTTDTFVRKKIHKEILFIKLSTNEILKNIYNFYIFRQNINHKKISINIQIYSIRQWMSDNNFYIRIILFYILNIKLDSFWRTKLLYFI